MRNLKVGLMSLVVTLSAVQSALAVRIDWEKDPVEKVAVKKAAFMGRRIDWVTKVVSCDNAAASMIVNEGQVEAQLACGVGADKELSVIAARFAFPDLRYDEKENKIFAGDEVVAVGGGVSGSFSMAEDFTLKSKVVPVSIDNRPAGVLIFLSVRRVVKDETPTPFPGTTTP